MKTALVLSAGGYFGAWQVGAWRAIEVYFRPDVVIGASVGSLNGWAIAGGAPAMELASLWLDERTAALVRWRRPPAPWRGLFDPRPLEETAQTLYARFRPRVPFAATLVEVPRLRLRLVRDTEMTWRHLAATCAVPGGYPAARLDGHWYVDGGLLGALPLWAAAEMGATRVVALDALPCMPSRLLRGGVRLVQRLGDKRHPPAELAVLRIRPSLPLGSLGDSVRWRQTNIRRWIAQGEQDARNSFTI